jgi:transketolase
MLLYSLLHLTGYDLTLHDIQNFRQWGSRTPGHPETHVVPGVEATTGPLGQGAGNAVGMAIAERALAARFNRPGHTIVDHHTYALCSDGDLMEGIVAEAASLAGHLKLGKLTFLFDSNHVSLDGPTSTAFTEDVGRRFNTAGRCCGLRMARLAASMRNRAARTSGRPSLIIVQTTIGRR